MYDTSQNFFQKFISVIKFEAIRNEITRQMFHFLPFLEQSVIFWIADDTTPKSRKHRVVEYGFFKILQVKFVLDKH